MWCCVGTGMENHGKYGQFVYTHTGDSLYVNLFMASRLHDKARGLTLTQRTDFPYAESTRLEMALDKPARFVLKLRHPGWCDAMRVRVNGVEQPAASAPQSYLALDREWHDGDVVELDLPMHFDIERLHKHPEYIAIMRGPIVLGAKAGSDGLDGLLADDTRWAHIAHGPLVSVFDTPVVLADSAALLGAVKPAGSPMHYTLEGVFADPSRKVELQPFSTIHDSRYMMYWLSMTPEAYAAHRDEMRRAEERMLALDRRTVDAVNTGEQQPEADHFMKTVSSSSGVAFGRPYRKAWNGGFSYRLRTQRRSDLSLIVTYWGNQTGRNEHDILVDGVVLARESVGDRWRKEQFVDVEYALPADVAERDSITVEFRSPESQSTGDVFHVRLVRKESNN